MNTNHLFCDGVVGTILEFKRGKVLCTNSPIFVPEDNDYSIDFYYYYKDEK